MGGGVVGREWLPTVRMGTTQRRDGGAPEVAPDAGRAISVQGVQSAIARWPRPQPLTLAALLKAFPSYKDSPKVLPQPGAVCSQPPGEIENCLTHLATMEFATSRHRADRAIIRMLRKKPRHPNWGQGFGFARDRRLRQAERRGFDPILSQNSIRHLRGGEPQGDFGLIGGGVVHQHIGNPQTQHRGGNLGI
jgi:hypothetical protein